MERVLLVQMVDVHTLQPEKDSFIDRELKEVFSDLLFKAQINGCEGYIYFLFEHKSYVTNDIALQLLKYMLNIWEAKYKKEKKEKLPIIIPIVVYHGKNSRHTKSTLGEMPEGYDELPDSVKRFVPNFQTLLYDFTQYTDAQIKGDVKQRMTVILPS